MASDPAPPSFADIAAAAARLEGRIHRTPLLTSAALNEIAGGQLLIKAETEQLTGSFKIRGALNRIRQLNEAERRGGVVAYSSGNHAQGVAAAAAMEGIRAVIVMPSDAPSIKIEGTRSHGAEIVFYDRYSEDREAIAQRVVVERGATLVPPYEDPRIIAGQGTVGIELFEQAREIGATIDAVLVPCGGGGLTAGIATVLHHLSPATDIYAVEPEGLDDTGRSLRAGKRLTNDPEARSFCDALLAATPGKLTFSINRRLLAGGVAVNDAETGLAMALAHRDLGLKTEPGGAVALAAALTGKIDCRDWTVAVVLSGGNVDPKIFADAIETATSRAGGRTAK